MLDIQSLHLALGAMPQKERDDFLGAALLQQPLESQDVILQKLDLKELPANSKVQIVFRMGLSPVAHAFRGGQDRQLRWVIPQVPDHLRTLVYSTSRLINEFQETLACLQNGRGDFVKAFALLNPETMMEMVSRFSDEMQNYTQQLRDANGRFNRIGPQRARRTSGTRPAASGQTATYTVKDQGGKERTGGEYGDDASTPVGGEATQKTRKTGTKARSKTPAAETVTDTAPNAESAPVETTADEASPPMEHLEAAPAVDVPVTEAGDDLSSPSTQEALAAFGFDVRAVAAEDMSESPADESGK